LKKEFPQDLAKKSSSRAAALCNVTARSIWPPKKIKNQERFLLRKNGKGPRIFFVDMEIMKTLTSSFGKIYGPVCLALCTASSVFASDIVLQKVPPVTAPTSADSASRLGPQATFALINYSLANTRQARALYVSSGNDLKLANSIIDDQSATSFGFSAEDNSPTAVIDLGKVSTVRHLSATYSARPGSIDFYVMKSLPGADSSPDTWKLDEKTFASLKPVGSTVDDGTRGSAAVDFPATTGRYVMVRWTPASHADGAFTMAEVTASGPDQRNLIASSRNFSSASTEHKVAADSKDVADSKDLGDSKDLPEVAEPPAEGPPPPLPNPPPFTFIPQLEPVSR
jgi:hypothetical protein